MVFQTLKPLFLLLPFLFFGCEQTPPPNNVTLKTVGAYTLSTQSLTLTQEMAGRTKASMSAEIRPQVGGIIKERLFKEGDLVKQGSILYTIDDASYQAAYEEAKASLANAQASVEASRLKYERYTELLSIEGVSKQDVEDAKSAYLQALSTVDVKKAALESARINVAYTKIKAPISGRIGISSVTEGALVTTNQTSALATIRALDPMYVDMTQSSTQLLKLRALLEQKGVEKGSVHLSLKLEDGSIYAHKGELQFQEVAVDESTGSVTLRAIFPNPKGLLLPGMYVRAMMDEAILTQALLAPQQGISRDPKGNATAMVLSAENKIEVRKIRTERAIEDKWLIREGLSAGDRLVVEGINKVKKGDSVIVVDVTQSLGKAQ
ncbi:efflux RND transporter periplasmic adaptor subunit [Sulfurospirillum barnesii]|uniref:RND family efflux transporter, MFP subunit n=1 Tax=Sulfurospirillum barnesii (strain ATCC 700032 / DSM 10660 / SES-3) TaxID=760154 RepID=I3XZ95_SULBS|nr:efflux RND transporter periplasmic adaptor subunit [Sulfurospirillum barnesii]AFL69269.1 RND family efflux transporter, MFP subunit [Sulfurospirillum barnesii SES-3]